MFCKKATKFIYRKFLTGLTFIKKRRNTLRIFKILKYMGVWYNWLNMMKLNSPGAFSSYTISLIGVDKIKGEMNSSNHLK